MELTYVLLRRAAAISLACLLSVLLVAAWRAQSDVRQEGLGAAEAAHLASLLAALQNVPGEALEAQLERLREIGRSGHLRHLHFTVEDAASGAVLAQSAADASSPAMQPFVWLLERFQRQPPAEVSDWVVARDDDRGFRVRLTTDPMSEQREAFDNALGFTGILLLYSVCLLVAMYWAVRHAFAPLRPILDTIAAFEREDYGRRLPPLPVRELDAIGRALNGLATALHDTQEERRLLSLKLLTLQEDERARIARELHDELGQSLTAMRADAAWLLRRTAGQAELHEVVAEMEQQCARVQQDIRNLLGWLGSGDEAPGSGAVPLAELIETLVDSWRRRPGQIAAYRLALDVDDGALPQGLALNLYRMTQEALTNVARHAAARNVMISLVARPGAEVRWSVCDDGAGIPSFDDALQRGNGLAGIRERVWAHGGELEMASCVPSGDGLRLEARFPWPGANAVPEGPAPQPRLLYFVEDK